MNDFSPVRPAAEPLAASAALPVAAGFFQGAGNGRTVERLPHHGLYHLPVRLELRPPPHPLAYEVTTRWEERRRGEVTRAIITKHLTLAALAPGPRLLLSWATAPPTLRKPDLLPLEEVVLLLAGIYRHLVIETAATGQRLAVANHAEIVAAWAAIKQELVVRYGETDALTASLRAAVEAQVQDPARLLDSLHHDYSYSLLVANLYQQPFESGFGYTQARAFPHFLADTALHFHERLALGEPVAPGRATIHVRGQLDEPRTDRAAVARQVAALLALAPTPAAPPPPDPNALAFGYRAAYDLDVATGWPVAVTATVTCASPAGYAKEYDLTVQQL